MRLTTCFAIGALTLLGGCDRSAAPPPAAQVQPAPDAPAPQTAGGPVAPAPMVAPKAAPQSAPLVQDDAGDQAVPTQPVYTDYRPPLAQPRPIAAPWAPPPLLGEAIPPQPSPDAFWTGGYWVWRDQWVWAPGRWSRPPRPDYRWVPPYYEHRDHRVVFVDGFWSAPGVAFVRPAATLTIALAAVGAGVAVGRPPVGPDGPFVPPPPGSRWGLIVPAPIGTPPSVVRGAPAIVAPGMRVNGNVVANDIHNDIHNTTINNRNTTINRITNVTIEAPASATVDHRPVHDVVAPQTHLAAGMQAIPGQREPAAAAAAPGRPEAPTTPRGGSETERTSPRGPAVGPEHGPDRHPGEQRPAGSQAVAPSSAGHEATPRPSENASTGRAASASHGATSGPAAEKPSVPAPPRQHANNEKVPAHADAAQRPQGPQAAHDAHRPSSEPGAHPAPGAHEAHPTQPHPATPGHQEPGKDTPQKGKDERRE